MLCTGSTSDGFELRGRAVRQDGRSASLTAPNGSAQRTLLKQTLGRASVAVSDIGVVEAHGTGTALGDPTEAGALAAVLDVPAAVGVRSINAAKGAIGHTEAASGQVGLLRAMKQLCTGNRSGNSHLRALNPLVGEALGRQLEQLLPTQCSVIAVPLRPIRCGISAFGYSGTIAHAILHAQPEPTWRRKTSAVPLALQRQPFPWQAYSHSRTRSTHHLSATYIQFLGLPVSPSAGSSTMEWEQQFTSHELLFLQGHRVGWVSLLPGTCYIELARAMVSQLFGPSLFTLSETKFENILFLDDTEIRGAPFLRVAFDEARQGLVAVSSRQHETAWTSNSTMKLRRRDASRTAPLAVTDLELDRARNDGMHVEAASFYANTGNDYRGEFRAMKQAWNLGVEGVVSTIECEWRHPPNPHLTPKAHDLTVLTPPCNPFSPPLHSACRLLRCIPRARPRAAAHLRLARRLLPCVPLVDRPSAARLLRGGGRGLQCREQ